MVKRYILEIAIVILILLTAALLSGKPAMNPGSPQASPSLGKAPPAEVVKEGSGFDHPVVPDQAIKERNLFAANGSYLESTDKPMPDNPYNLIAVLQGKEKKAVFRDYLGKVVTFVVGKEMMDKFVIAHIDNVSVQLLKGDEKKELRLFNAGGGNLAPAPDSKGVSPRDRKNLYTLTGILGAGEKKAVFRDYNGTISILGVGARLSDGAMITRVDDFSVKLDKAGEKSELKVFDVHNSEQSVRKKND
ncbi:MAG: hypothetical protein ACOYOS_14865 [Syntrophales bacterium]